MNIFIIGVSLISVIIGVVDMFLLIFLVTTFCPKKLGSPFFFFEFLQNCLWPLKMALGHKYNKTDDLNLMFISVLNAKCGLFDRYFNLPRIIIQTCFCSIDAIGIHYCNYCSVWTGYCTHNYIKSFDEFIVWLLGGVRGSKGSCECCVSCLTVLDTAPCTSFFLDQGAVKKGGCFGPSADLMLRCRMCHAPGYKRVNSETML